MMPGEDGLSLCRRLRAPGTRWASLPVIFLTALQETTDKVVGLEIGGDDYLGKPFQARELIARVRALLRRASMSGGEPRTEAPHAGGNYLLVFGGWKLNVMARHLIDETGVAVPLSAAEFRLLMLLLRHPQQVVTRDMIMGLSCGAQPEHLRQEHRRAGEPSPREAARQEREPAADPHDARRRLHARLAGAPRTGGGVRYARYIDKEVQ